MTAPESSSARGRVFKLYVDVRSVDATGPDLVDAGWSYVVRDLWVTTGSMIVRRGGGYPTQAEAFTACCAAFREWWYGS